VRRSPQAAEKAYKAALIKAQIEFPRIHDLERLQQLLPAESQLRGIDVDLASLTEWSIAGRYPADAREAYRQDAEQAVRDAHAVVDVVAAMFAPAPEGEAAEE
jgi:HEPN domain-containing protein